MLYRKRFVTSYYPNKIYKDKGVCTILKIYNCKLVLYFHTVNKNHKCIYISRIHTALNAMKIITIIFYWYCNCISDGINHLK